MTQSVSSGRKSAYSQRTIGLLADWFDEHYQHTILRTVEEAVAQRGSNSLAFGGGIPGSRTRSSERRQLAFDLIAPSNVDGVILLAGTMVNELGSEALEQLMQRLDGLPSCAIGIEVPGVPSLLVDNQLGIDQAMTHLVERHSAHRVAFIRGPHKNKEAESRFAAYRAALERANIAYDDRLVFQGDFLQESGRKAIRHWLESSIHLDAVIAANDEMAIGALRQLTDSGKSVPGDVALIGFDDLEGAQSTTPPLTTVRQPLKDLAIAAVRTVMDQIAGRDVPRLQVMQTHLVVRDSCGCSLQLSSTGQSLHPDSSRPVAGGFRDAFAQRKQSLKAELQRAARGEFQSLGAWEDRLIASFATQLEDEEPAFLEELAQGVASIANAGGDVSRWHDVVTAFRRYSLPCCGIDYQLRARAEDVLHEARMSAANAVERREARRRMDLERFSRRLVNVGSSLAGSFDFAELGEAVARQLPRLGVVSAYVAVYDPMTLTPGDGLPSQAHLVAVFDSESNLPLTGEPFEPREMSPISLWPPARPYRFVVLPLFLKDVDLGFALIECPKAAGSVLEAVREQLSIALYGALIARQLPPSST